jgi:hypothetical protein
MHTMSPARTRLTLVLSLLAACKTYDPLFCDESKPCTDPDRPFCDLNGDYPASGGIGHTCIPDPGIGSHPDGGPALEPDASAEPVSCMQPGEALECTEDTLVLCTAESIEQRVECPLGCAAEELRCLDLKPGNDLAVYLDQAAAAAPLVLTGLADFDTDTGNLLDAENNPISVQTAFIEAPSSSDAVDIRVLIANRVDIESLRVDGFAAFAIVSDGDVVIRGRLSVDGDDRFAGPGAIISFSNPCVGEPGESAMLNGQLQYGGGGGGGHRTAGAAGGSVTGVAAGGPGGVRFDNLDLVPLRGGCAGSGVNGANGGGAIQVVSRTRIELLEGAIINANGGGGSERGGGGDTLDPAGGGGAGGGILLEAPVVVAAGGLFANGGGGGGFCSQFPQPGQESREQALGSQCSSTNMGDGGSGASVLDGASEGESAQLSTTLDAVGGSGGGSVGYIRINNARGIFLPAPTALLSPTAEVGRTATR